MRTVTKSAVSDRSGYTLAPIQPSLRLEEISERARLRALAAKAARNDWLVLSQHQRALHWIERSAA